MSKYYAIAKGKAPGIYTSWAVTQPLVSGYPGAIYKSFPTLREAEQWLYEINGSSTMQIVPLAQSISSALPVASVFDYHIYTDGSSVKGIGGWAVVIVSPTTQQVVSQYFGRAPFTPICTNNQAELYALLTAVHNYPNNNVQIFSDSQYSISAVTTWVHNWIRNGWKTAKGEPVENQELIQAIYDKLQQARQNGKRVELTHIYAHRGHEFNELADSLANQGRSLPLP